MERDSALENASVESATPTATVRRVTAVLDAFIGTSGELGVTELAGQLGLAKSVVHRLVTALTEAEYLTQNEGTRRYTLGPKALRLGLVALGQLDIRERAVSHLQALAAETGETATLSLLTGDHRIYAEQVESTQTIRQTVAIGVEAPLYVGASGKAILAFLPPARRAALLRHVAGAGVIRADGSRLDSEELNRDLEMIRRRGFATSLSERVLGATSAAAPVFDCHGNVVGSISVAGVTVRHGQAELNRFGKIAQAYAKRLSMELGWSGRPADSAAS